MSNFPQPQPVDLKEKLDALDSVPLFMKSLPEEDTGDAVISALQSLAYEGTPDEIATNFKEQGNEYFQGKRYREALGFYTQGIDSKPENKALREALYCNRAACNLELHNYGSVLRDCSKALLINPYSLKALYRSAVALVALGRLDEASDCCERCLSFDKENKAAQGLKERAGRLKTEKEKKEVETLERMRREKQQQKALKVAFRERNLILLPNPKGSSNPYEPRFNPEDSTNKSLVFPVFFLYPQHAISDVVPDYLEDTKFADHLRKMFPPEGASPDWDKTGEYVVDNLVLYATTHRQRLLKLSKKKTLKDVFNASKAKDGEPSDGLEVKDGCVTIIILPKGSVEGKWVDDFKASRDA